jgi:uncharacterized membrane protein
LDQIIVTHTIKVHVFIFYFHIIIPCKHIPPAAFLQISQPKICAYVFLVTLESATLFTHLILFFLFVLTTFGKEYAHVTTYVAEEESRQNRTLHNERKMSEINARNILLIGHNHLIPNRYLSNIPYHILKMMMML